MKIIIAGGGTGGHIFPAISIAEELIRKSRDNEILFVGTENGMEKDLIPDKGFKLALINSRGIIGKGFIYKLRSAISALDGIFSSFKILRSFKPDLVLGVGGYVSGPTVLSAYLNFIPTAICEQNTVPGFTNRILSKIAKKIFVTFQDSVKYFPERKVIVTGNPLRTGILNGKLSNNEKNKSFTIFIMGGSQGASKLNKIIPVSLSGLQLNNLRIVHQTGRADKYTVENMYKNLKINAEVHSFIEDIAGYYIQSDLVISRSGAGTISEITAFGKPSILIPYPYAAHNHQYMNAKFMEKECASVIIEEKFLTSELLQSKIMEIINDGRLQSMSEAAAKLAKPEAAELIVEELYSLVGN